MKKIAIIGTGGIGGYFGAKLLQHGYDVRFLARGKHLQALKDNGLTVKSIHGDFKIDPVNATDSIKSMGIVDLVLVCVKAWQIKDICPELKSIVGKDTLVLPLQNGVLTADEISEYIDKDRVLGGLCRIISKVDAPGIINHVGIEPTLIFGELNKQTSKRTDDLVTVFNDAGIKAWASKDIKADLWKKFIGICVSGLLAVTRTTYGELRELKETRTMMVDLLTEIYNLSQAIDIKLSPDFLPKAIAFIDTFPANSSSSLTRDIWEGKPSEIEYQNGTVVKLAQQYNVETPVNSFVYHCILPMELKARKNL